MKKYILKSDAFAVEVFNTPGKQFAAKFFAWFAHAHLPIGFAIVQICLNKKNACCFDISRFVSTWSRIPIFGARELFWTVWVGKLSALLTERGTTPARIRMTNPNALCLLLNLRKIDSLLVSEVMCMFCCPHPVVTS